MDRDRWIRRVKAFVEENGMPDGAHFYDDCSLTFCYENVLMGDFPYWEKNVLIGKSLLALEISQALEEAGIPNLYPYPMSSYYEVLEYEEDGDGEEEEDSDEDQDVTHEPVIYTDDSCYENQKYDLLFRNCPETEISELYSCVLIMASKKPAYKDFAIAKERFLYGLKYFSKVFYYHDVKRILEFNIKVFHTAEGERREYVAALKPGDYVYLKKNDGQSSCKYGYLVKDRSDRILGETNLLSGLDTLVNLGYASIEPSAYVTYNSLEDTEMQGTDMPLVIRVSIYFPIRKNR